MSTLFDDTGLAAALWIVIKASALLGVAALAQLALYRRASAATRHFLWAVAVLSVLLLPVVSVAIPDWTVGIRVERQPAPVPAAVDHTATATGAGTLSVPTVTWLESRSVASPQVSVTWKPATLSAYAIGTIGILAFLVLQHWTVWRFARRATLLHEAEWARLLDTAVATIGVRRPVRLLLSREHTVPFSFGLRRASIVIPAVAEAWAEDRRRAVLFHELAHVARYDCLTQTLALVACAMYWFHPAVWAIARRLRVERELACDDRVIEAGTVAREYAAHLLEIAYASAGRRTPVLAVSMARPRQLEGRMLAALDERHNRSVPTMGSRVAATAIAAAFVCPLAAATPAIVTVGSEASPVASMSREAAAPVPAAPDTTSFPRRAALRTTGIAQDGLPGTWEIRPSGTEGMVNLRLVEPNSSSSTNVPIARLEGLARAQLSGAGGPVQFRVRRDAGTFTFEGVIRNGVGAGTFSFSPDSNFPAELAKRGFARPTEREQYQMARHDIGYAFLDELNAQGYSKPATSELVRAGQHGVNAPYVRDMGALGYRLGSLQPLIELRDHGVTPDYVRALAELGYKGLSHEQIRRARDHGITAEHVRAMRDAGYGSLPMDDLITARDHGVTAEYVRQLGDAGQRKLPLEDLVKVRDHGVTPEYIRDMSQLGYALPLNELIRARDHGVTVDYVREMTALGYKGQSMDALVRVRDHGVTSEYAQEIKALGYTGVTLDELVTLRDHGLTAERIRAANTRAGTRLPIDLLKSLAAGGMR